MENNTGDCLAMKEKLNLIWIDDDEERKKQADELAKKEKVNVDFISVVKKDLQVELNNIFNKYKEKEPDLILIDHKLDKVNGKLIQTGSTAAEIIREHEKWNDCPVVCVTGVDPEKYIGLHRKHMYDAFLEIDDVLEKSTMVISVADGFHIMKQNRPKNLEDIFQLIKVPKDDETRITEVLPENLKMHFDDKSLLTTICHWVRNVLLEKPGFLYDRLWAATLMGIKEESFIKVEKHFEEAVYKGIFTDSSNKRWWQSMLRDKLFSLIDVDEYISKPWDAGRKLKGISIEDYSKCYVCGKTTPAPETVGFPDEESHDRYPMHRRCTVPHPKAEQSLFFEEIRMMKADDRND
jgi:CheY-like chemotaxis protein